MTFIKFILITIMLLVTSCQKDSKSNIHASPDKPVCPTCTPPSKKPIASECSSKFLANDTQKCETGMSIGNWKVVTKDQFNEPILKHQGLDFLITSITDRKMTGREFGEFCSSIEVEDSFKANITKFQLVRQKHLDDLIEMNYDDVLRVKSPKLILNNKDEEGWQKVSYALTGERAYYTHPENNKYTSLCIAYLKKPFGLGKIYLGWVQTVWIRDWIIKNQSKLREVLSEKEIELAERRCQSIVNRVRAGDIGYSYKEDANNTGLYHIYGESDSLFECS